MTDCRFGRPGLLAIAVIAATSMQAQAGPRAVLELFTSQGCSSCPPADKLLGEFSTDPSVIALSLAINYWDYLGWKDTLALAGHTNRQKAYSRVRGDRDVYTPQVVVNGSLQALGSSKADIENAVAQSRRDPMTLSLPVSLSVADGRVTVTAPAPAKAADQRGEVWLCPVTKAISVTIGRGENNGRTITYHNVVRRWIKMGEWNGMPATWSLPVKDVATEGVDEIAVIVQLGTAANPGPMVAAAVAPIR